MIAVVLTDDQAARQMSLTMSRAVVTADDDDDEDQSPSYSLVNADDSAYTGGLFAIRALGNGCNYRGGRS